MTIIVNSLHLLTIQPVSKHCNWKRLHYHYFIKP